MDDLKTLFFLGMAVFVAWRLWSVLGETTGNEKPPSSMGAPKSPEPDNNSRVAKQQYTGDSATVLDLAPDRWAGFAKEGSEQEQGLNAIARIEKNFNAEQFCEAAKDAYEMIVDAFAKGDRATLKDFLAKDVFENFDLALKEREKRGERVETTFVSIDKADFTKVEVLGKSAFITLSFLSKLITATRDKDGTVVDGDASLVVDVSDIWTFSRVLGSRDPNWTLVATEEGA